MRNKIPRVAVAGLGGFAMDHHSALARLEVEGVCKVVAACDPDSKFALTQAEKFEFRERWIEVFGSLDELLRAHHGSIDLVTLPTPIPLHAEQHRMVVKAKAGCYLEKPPSLWWPEFCAMREIDAGASQATHVGFNFVGDPFRRALKGRAIDGEFGALLEVRLHAVWPRDAAYYARNNWAGKIRAGGRWVLDSCIGNALAHYVQNLLFWCGADDVYSIGRIGAVRARLGRTRPIQNFDTAFVEAQMAGGVVLRIGATHIESGSNFDQETLIFEGATVVFERWNRARIEFASGSVETIQSEFADQAALLRHNLATYLDYLAGSAPRPITTFGDSESFVALCGLALVSSGAVDDIDELPDLKGFLDDGRWPRSVPESVTMSDLGRLEAVATRVLEASHR